MIIAFCKIKDFNVIAFIGRPFVGVLLNMSFNLDCGIIAFLSFSVIKADYEPHGFLFEELAYLICSQ